jgi:hypothetical protein
MAHQASTEELKPFRKGSHHNRNILIMAGLGVVLFVAGILLSLVKLPAEEGGDHGPAAPAGKEEHHDGAGGGHKDHHSDAGGKTTVQYASAGHKVAPNAHEQEEGGGGHSDPHSPAEPNEPNPKSGHHTEPAHGGHGMHVIFDDTAANGTWRRAHWHADQEIGAHHEKEVTLMSKIGVSFLMGTYWWFAVALFGVFWIAVSVTANASWYVMFRRIIENYYGFLYVAIGLLMAVFFGFGSSIYEWVAVERGHDALIDGKRGFLNAAFIVGTGALLVGIWAFIGHMFRKNSMEEEVNGGTTYFFKQRGIALIFLPLFGFGFSAFAFLWIMSVDPHWFSTIYAVYCFAGLFLTGFTVTMFLTTSLKREGYMPNFSADHLHDIGKLMFAFSVFWGYIWVSQYLLIWYANIPEETIYYYNRFQEYKALFGLNVVINFFFPFIVLMTRDAKRKAESLRFAGGVMLGGRFLDLFLLLVPGALGSEGGFSVMLMGAGMVCLVGALFLQRFYAGINGVKLEPRNHPYFEESVHHSTGV